MTADILGGIVVYTLVWKWQQGNWWFIKDKRDYHIYLDNYKWELGGIGLNPMETIQKMLNGVTGSNKSIKDTIRERTRKAILAKMGNTSLGETDSEAIEAFIQKTVKEVVDEELGKNSHS